MGIQPADVTGSKTLLEVPLTVSTLLASTPRLDTHESVPSVTPTTKTINAALPTARSPPSADSAARPPHALIHSRQTTAVVVSTGIHNRPRFRPLDRKL